MKNKIKLILLAIGTFFFEYIFWKESLGNNAFIFSAFAIIAMIFAFPASFKSLRTITVSLGVLLSSAAVAYHASIFSIIIWIMSLFMVPSFIHHQKIKAVFFGFVISYVDYFSSLNLPFENIKINKNILGRFSNTFRFLKLTLIPLVVLFIFYWIFKFANPIFDEISTKFFTKIGDWLRELFKDISATQVLFVIWGFTLMIYFLYKKINAKEIEFENNYSDKIIRQRKPKDKKGIYSTVRKLKLDLVNEYRTGLILIFLINALLLIINIIDINWVWFGFEYTQDFDLKQFVHEGTYLLILSILISIAIMVYFFRANLNFYPKAKLLRIAAYAWLFQNAILTVSVALRNLKYIDHYGLAYKRIGLFFFLALVIFGLITLIFKIKYQKTTFKMIKENSWAVYIGFILFAIPDWDPFIAKKNLANPIKENIDVSYLLTMDDKVLPLIDKHNEILLHSKDNDTYKFYYEPYTEIFDKRVDKFMKNYKDKSLFARNKADDKAYEYFKLKYPFIEKRIQQNEPAF